MSFNPRLGDPSDNSSWETVSSNSDSSQRGTSSVFFGGVQHTFSVFDSSSSSSDITSGGRSSSFSSFSQGMQQSTSLPDMAKNIEHSFEEKGTGDGGGFIFDPSELAGRSVSLDSGIDKNSKRSTTNKIRQTVLGFFKGSPKAPSMKSFMGSSPDFPDPYEQKTDKSSSPTEAKIQEKPKTSTSGSKKTGSFSGLKGIFKGSVKSSTKPKVSPKPPFSGVKKTDISGPISSTSRPIPSRPAPQPPVQPRMLEDQLKSIWTHVETTSPQTYGWVGSTVLTQGMRQVGDKILNPGDKNVSIPKGFINLLTQCTSQISKNSDELRSTICALLDTVTDPGTRFSEHLDNNEGSQSLVNLLVKVENTLSPPRMRLFLSMLADNVGGMTSSRAKSLTTSDGGIDSKLGASAVQDSLSNLNTLLQGGFLGNWSQSLQVIANDTFS